MPFLNPKAITRLNDVGLPIQPVQMSNYIKRGDYIYSVNPFASADGDIFFQIIDDAKNRTWVQVISQIVSSGFPTRGGRDMIIDGDYAYIVRTSGLTIIDISNPLAPSVIGSSSDVSNCYNIAKV